MEKFKKVKVIGNVIGFNRYAFSKKETYNVQFPDMTIAELEKYQFEDADAYHTDGKPLCLRNVLARLHGLPEHDREVWLKAIMSEFEQDFSHAKWREGYDVEQEKRYEIVVPHTKNYKKQQQNLVKQKNNWFFCGNDINRFTYQFTKGQIEAAGFGWVFDCEGVEVQEVQDDTKI